MTTLRDLVDPSQLEQLRALAGDDPAAAGTSAAELLEVKGPDTDVDGMEHKAAPTGTTAVLDLDDEKGLVTALVSATGIEDRVGDTIEPGAYTKTLAQNEPIGVWSHDDKVWVARAEQVTELPPGDPLFAGLKTNTGEPWPAQAGALLVKARFNLETPHGAAAYSDVKFFKGKTGWSIGYRVHPGTRRDPRTGKRSIKGLDLFEFSPVMVGAAPQAMTLSVKSLSGAHAVDPDEVPELPADELGQDEVKAMLAARDDLEVKVRRVRTAAGAAQYGQPIGSVIRTDSVRGMPSSSGSGAGGGGTGSTAFAGDSDSSVREERDYQLSMASEFRGTPKGAAAERRASAAEDEITRRRSTAGSAIGGGRDSEDHADVGRTATITSPVGGAKRGRPGKVVAVKDNGDLVVNYGADDSVTVSRNAVQLGPADAPQSDLSRLEPTGAKPAGPGARPNGNATQRVLNAQDAPGKPGPGKYAAGAQVEFTPMNGAPQRATVSSFDGDLYRVRTAAGREVSMSESQLRPAGAAADRPGASAKLDALADMLAGRGDTVSMATVSAMANVHGVGEQAVIAALRRRGLQVKGVDDLDDLELKAGRMLSSGHVTKVLQAYEQLGTLLRAAGVLDDDLDDDAPKSWGGPQELADQALAWAEALRAAGDEVGVKAALDLADTQLGLLGVEVKAQGVWVDPPAEDDGEDITELLARGSELKGLLDPS